MVNFNKWCKKILAIVGIFFIFAANCFSREYVFDNARILTVDTKSKLSAKLEKISEKTGSYSIIYTVNATDKTVQDAADDYLDELLNYKQGQNVEGSLILVALADMTGNRKVHISTSGTNTIATLTDIKISELLDKFVEGYEKNGSYDDGLHAYVKKLEFYISGNSISEEDAAGGGLAGLIAMILAYFRNKKSYKLRKRNMPPVWEKTAKGNFMPFKDVVIDREVFYREISSSSSGGSSTHTSSSGNRHGGGGRSF